MNELRKLTKGEPDWHNPVNENMAELDKRHNLIVSPEMHRNIYRGKFLGTSVTPQQLQAIRSGTFDDLFIGDYWTINSIDWLIADMNYWLHTGDLGVGLTQNHLIIVPRQSLFSARMNPTNTTNGGYLGSEMNTVHMARAVEIQEAAFGANRIPPRWYLTSAVTNGLASAGAWVTRWVELMSEVHVYGTDQVRSRGNGAAIGFDGITIDRSQFALFRLKPEEQLITDPVRASYWLRDIISATGFAYVNNAGITSGRDASTSSGVRPCFAIG